VVFSVVVSGGGVSLFVGEMPMTPSGLELCITGSSVVVVVGYGVGDVVSIGVVVGFGTGVVLGVFVFVGFPPPTTSDVSVFTAWVALLTAGIPPALVVFVFFGDAAGTFKDCAELASTGVSGEGPPLGVGDVVGVVAAPVVLPCVPAL
jgi:hypothetical protein